MMMMMTVDDCNEIDGVGDKVSDKVGGHGSEPNKSLMYIIPDGG